MSSPQRLGALRRAARGIDLAISSAPGRRAAEQRFLHEARELHPNATEDEILEHAAAIRRAFFLQLSAKGVAARRAARR